MWVIAVYVANVTAFGLIALRARWEDWAAIILFGLALVAEAMIGQISVGTWRIGLAATNVGLLVGVWILAERGNRWWIIFAAMAQLATVATHIAQLFQQDLLVWSGALARNILYGVISILFFVGAWEAWADHEYRLKGGAH